MANVEILKMPTTLTITGTNVNTNIQSIISGKLSNKDGGDVINSNIRLVTDGKTLNTPTNSSGNYNIGNSYTTAGSKRIDAHFDGSLAYVASNSPFTNVTISNPLIATKITLAGEQIPSYGFRWTGRLTRLDNGAGIPSVQIYVFVHNVSLGTTWQPTANTNATGNFDFNHYPNQLGQFQAYAGFNGNATYAPCTGT
jgi:hypothetical protein